MKIITKIKDINEISIALREEKNRIGFVPTMGYLHKGHISLIEKSKKHCTKTILSIFVNPAQFGPEEDFKKYPRDIKRDIKMAEEAGVDYIFNPDVREMYKADHKTFVEIRDLKDIMCGKFRPAHFDGVCTIVLKLFNIIRPHRAYFGQKDYQQLAIIKKMVKDLNIGIEIIGCPIIREPDGLALSSRNKYLSHEERASAIIIYKSLRAAAEYIKGHKNKYGETISANKFFSKEKIKIQGKNIKDQGLKEFQSEIINKILEDKNISKVDYFEFRDSNNLEEIKNPGIFYSNQPNGKILIAAAVWIGDTRLIDNIVI